MDLYLTAECFKSMLVNVKHATMQYDHTNRQTTQQTNKQTNKQNIRHSEEVKLGKGECVHKLLVAV